MASDIINLFDHFVEDLAKGVHNLDVDLLTIALSNTLPDSDIDETLSNIFEISYTNLSTRFIPGTITAVETAGVLKLLCASDLTLTASGAVPTFQYIIIYNDTPTSPLDPLIGWYDFGTTVTMANTETFLVDFDQSGGVFTMTQP